MRIEPVPGRESFDERGLAARLSQAGLILGAGAGVAGRLESLDEPARNWLPELAPVRAGRLSLREAATYLPVDADAYAREGTGPVDPAVCSDLARRLYDAPDPLVAAGLVEAGLHHATRLVRTAAAAAALDTTGPRQLVVEILEGGTTSRNETVRDMARIALARVDRFHPALRRLTVPQRPQPEGRRPSHTAAITHGSFAARQTWWRPGGDFYIFLDRLAPPDVPAPLHMHNPSFEWSGAYSADARAVAAASLVAWAPAQGLDRPDFFAHSHGATVANLATLQGLRLSRLVHLSWPMRVAELPNLDVLDRLISIRVHFDLVITVDGGGQRLPDNVLASPKVRERIDGWFSHSASHDPKRWQDEDWAAEL